MRVLERESGEKTFLRYIQRNGPDAEGGRDYGSDEE